MHIFLNFVAFQVGWFSSVLGAAKQMPWLGPLVLIGIVIIHLRQAHRPGLEAGLIIACGVIGAHFDSVLVALGWVTYTSGYINTSLAPYWIVTMWMLFATTLNRSMTWLKGRLALAAVMGAIAGPMSYYAGSKLGGIVFETPLPALVVLSVGWALIMPVVVMLSERLNGFDAAYARTHS